MRPLPGLPARASSAAVVIAAAALALVTGGASASVPFAGRTYRGTLPDYMNNASHWAREATSHVLVRVNSHGTQVHYISASYSWYCGAGHSTEHATRVPITRHGGFSTKGKFNEKYGTDYIVFSGRFRDGGRKVSVSYLFNFVYAGHPVAHPYRPVLKSGSCESWVHGTIDETR